MTLCSLLRFFHLLVAYMRHLPLSSQIDLVVNRTNGLANTALLVQYLSLDERVRPLILAIKQWAKNRGICNARNSTLSSYGWTLLALHFLQHTSPPVLPKLLAMQAEDPAAISTAPWNTDSMGTLLLKFFAYYGLPHVSRSGEELPFTTELGFNLFRQVVTLDGDGCQAKTKTSSPVTVTEVGPVGDASGFPTAPWWRFSIQDPLDATFDVGRIIHCHEGQVLILNELRRALNSLLKLHPQGAGGNSTVMSYGEKNYPYETLCTLNENVPDLAMKCHLCGGSDHLSAECPDARCEQCHSRDHTSRNCPNKICYRCRGYHVKSQCPLLLSSSGTVTTVGGGRETSVIPLALLEGDDLRDEGEDRSRKRRGCDGDGFMEEVLRWQVKDFTNEKLFQSELRRIPLEFESSTAWYRTFHPFLLEEMRSQIQKVAVGSFYMTPRSLVKFYNPNLPDEMMITPTLPAYMILSTGLDEAKYEEACTCTVGLLVNTAKNANRELTAEALAKIPHLLVRIEVRLKADGYNLAGHELELLRQHPGCMIFNIMLPNSPTAVDLLNTSLAKGTNGASQWELLAIGVGTYSSIRTCDALAKQESPQLIMEDVVTGQNVCAAVSDSTLPLRGSHEEDVSDEFTSSLNDSQQSAVRQVLEVGSPLGISTTQIIKGPPGTKITTFHF